MRSIRGVYYVIKPPPLAEDPKRFNRSGVGVHREKSLPPCVRATEHMVFFRGFRLEISNHSLVSVNSTALNSGTNTFYAPFERAS
jgi:hypothetical protein